VGRSTSSKPHHLNLSTKPTWIRLVTDVHDGHTPGPLLTDAERLLLYVRRLEAPDFVRVFRSQLPGPDLMKIINALPKERLHRLMTNARGRRLTPRPRLQEDFPDQPMARAIRLARKRAGLAQYELAKALGVCQSSVSQWERGAARPAGRHVVKLMGVLPELIDILKVQVARTATGEQAGPQTAPGPG
jgi:DNA-binding XRE family transcriptional regulator